MAEAISKELIFLNENLKTKEEVLEFITEKLEKENKINDKKDVLNHFVKREETASTYIGDDVSIPHARCSSIKETAIVYIKLEDSVLWDIEENDYAKYIFAIVVPEDASNLHLELLMSLSKKLLDDDYMKIFSESENKDKIAEIINN